MYGATELLATWESGLPAGELGRALLLHALARAGQHQDTADLLAVPVGQRDVDLFGLRRTLFGEHLNGRVSCAGCGEELEFDFDVTNVLRAGPPDAGPVTVRVGAWQVRFRLPTPGDLLAAAEAGSAEQARAVLIGRCVLAVDHGGAGPEAASGADLPAHVQERIAVAAAEADPSADIRLDVPCVECGYRTKAAIDIVSYLWAELDVWARSVLRDVHLLAGAYGWSEAEILALSPLRRRYYLELVGHA